MERDRIADDLLLGKVGREGAPAAVEEIEIGLFLGVCIPR